MFHNIRGIPCLAEGLLVPPEGLCYMETVISLVFAGKMCRGTCFIYEGESNEKLKV